MGEIDKISKIIKELRKEKNLTQNELGEKLEVSGKAVSKWERGESLPDITIIKKLSDILGISSDELLQGKINHTSKKTNIKYFILFLLILLVGVSLVIIIRNNNITKDNNITKEETPCTLIKTFYINHISQSNDKNYQYITISEYQIEGTYTIRLSSVEAKDIIKDSNYEFTFSVPKNYTSESVEELFNNRKIISINKTDKVGMETESKYIC